MLILPKYNIDSDIDFWTLWSDSILQFEPDTRKRFFHHISWILKEKQKMSAMPLEHLKDYDLKLEIIESVVVEGHCKNCDLYTQVAFKIHGYMQMVNRAYSNGVIIIPCPFCKKGGSVEYPILI